MILVVAFAAALGLATYAFTASNVVPGTKAGQGEGTISGYTVSGVAYTLAANPTNIDSVAFTLSAAATTVKAKVVQGSSPYTDCSVSGAASDLVLGSSGVDTIRGLGGSDCIVGGGANDSLRGDGGTDVCIGGPGTDTFHSSCETQIQ